jgi:lysophospholipase L1-like esterase
MPIAGPLASAGVAALMLAAIIVRARVGQRSAAPYVADAIVFSDTMADMTDHKRVKTIAALGSSFAAGPTIEPVEDVEAMRSSRNYAHLLAGSLGAALVDLTVSGATTANILHTPQRTMTGREFAPQLAGLPADVDLVTITAGGNDLQFIGSMLFAAWRRHDADGPLVQMFGQGFAEGLPEVTDDDIGLVAASLTEVVAGVRARSAGARVVLVDYLSVVTGDTPTGPDAVFDAEELSVFLRIQNALARAYQVAAERSGAELLAVSSISTGHGLGSSDPWVFGFVPDVRLTAGSFHPNAAGMQAVADELGRFLR